MQPKCCVELVWVAAPLFLASCALMYASRCATCVRGVTLLGHCCFLKGPGFSSTFPLNSNSILITLAAGVSSCTRAADARATCRQSWAQAAPGADKAAQAARRRGSTECEGAATAEVGKGRPPLLPTNRRRGAGVGHAALKARKEAGHCAGAKLVFCRMPWVGLLAGGVNPGQGTVPPRGPHGSPMGSHLQVVVAILPRCLQAQGRACGGHPHVWQRLLGKGLRRGGC